MGDSVKTNLGPKDFSKKSPGHVVIDMAKFVKKSRVFVLQNYQTDFKMGCRRAPGGANMFVVNNWGRARRGGPFEKKDGAKILIFSDFRFLRQNGPKSPPNDARGPNLVGID